MKQRLTFAETVSVASMLFGLFFGAGNLIFPAYMGQAAGANMLEALGGFLITGVGLPLLAVAALGLSRADGLLALSGQIGKGYGYFFTCALYLTIGPFFAIPRCFTVPFEAAAGSVLPAGFSPRLALFIFSCLFFAVMLWFSLRPGKILIWVGKVLNPMFLAVFFGVMIFALIKPMGSASAVEPAAGYAAAPFAQGFLEGYNTMDALAGLAFGIVVVNVIRSLGVEDSGDVAACTVRSGIFACLLMAVIYAMTALAGARSRGVLPLAENGGAALMDIVRYYFPGAGSYLFALMILLACIKTAIGLITSCSEAFVQMFPRSFGYNGWAVFFSLISFAIANVGLAGIIRFSLPVLMMLYPLAMALILLSFTERKLRLGKTGCRAVTAVTFACALGDLIAALPDGIRMALHLDGIQEMYGKVLPLYRMGLGWLIPAAAAFLVMAVWARVRGFGRTGEGN